MLVYFAPLLLLVITVMLMLSYLTKRGILTYLWIFFLIFLTIAWYSVLTCVPPVIQLIFCSIYAITIMLSISIYSTSIEGADYQTLDFIYFFCLGYIFIATIALMIFLFYKDQTESVLIMEIPFLIYCGVAFLLVINGY